MTHSPVLHVVYAGYGDSLLLEYTTDNKRHLVVVDGGPKTSHPRPGATTAPYSKYFVSATQSIWSAMFAATAATANPLPAIFSPLAIINSHPHKDHYDGLLELLKSSLPKGFRAHADAGEHMFFNGPMLVPLVPLMPALRREIDAVMGTWGFARSNWVDGTIPGIDIAFPDRNYIYRYFRTANDAPFKTGPPKAPDPDALEPSQAGIGGQVPGADTVFSVPQPLIDESRANIRSILVATNEASTGGRILLTGDSVGWLIDKKCLQPGVNNALPHFSIYKVQHHGSVKNNQLLDKADVLSEEITVEVALRELMELQWGHMLDMCPGCTPARREVGFSRMDLFGPEATAVAQACQHLKLFLAGNGAVEPVLNYLNLLRQRHALFVNRCCNLTINPRPLKMSFADFDALPQLAPTAAEVLIAVRNALMEAAEIAAVPYRAPTFQPDNNQLRNGISLSLFHYLSFDANNVTNIRSHDWWGDWAFRTATQFEWKAYYLTILSVRRVIDFYSRFTADVYVISANGEHDHPSAAVIVGLALALALAHRKATLYVTNGHSLNPSLLLTVARWFRNEQELAALFDPAQCLEIRYLSSGVYMSLDGATVTAQATRELTMRTTQYVFELGQNESAELHKLLEHDKSVLPARTLEHVNYAISNNPFLKINQWTWYLSFQGGDVTLVNQVPNPVSIKESWEVAGADGLFKVNFRAVQVLSGDRIFNLAVAGNPKGYQLRFDSANGPLSFYRETLNSSKILPINALEVTQGRVTPMEFYFHRLPQLAPVVNANVNINPQPALVVVGQQHAAAGIMANNMAIAPPLLIKELSTVGAAPAAPTQEKLVAAGVGPTPTTFSPLPPTETGTEIPAPETPPAPATLRAFLKAASISSADLASWSLRDAMTAILGAKNFAKFGAKNFAKLGFALGVETAALKYSVDVDATTVTFDDNGINTTVMAASIVCRIPAGEHFTTVGDKVPMTGASLAITWPPGKPLTATMNVLDKAKVITSVWTVDITDAVRTTNLTQLLTYICTRAELTPDFTTLGLPKLLGYFTDRMPESIAQLFAQGAPTVLISAGLLELQPDLQRSTAVAWVTPTGDLAIEKADIVCVLFPQNSENKPLSIAELDITFGDVIVTLDYARLPNQKLTLSGSIKASSLALSFSVSLSDPLPKPATAAVTWTFTASGTNSLSDLSALWPATPQSLSTPPPFAKSPLSQLTTSGIGFVLSQPVVGVAKYTVSSIFATTSFDDWKGFLPKDFPAPKDASATIRLEIRNPLVSELRAVGTAVDFTCAIKTGKVGGTGTAELKVALVAEPLATPKDYDYRLWISSSSGGVTVPEIGAAIGLGGSFGEIKDAVPFVGRVLDAVRLKVLSIELRQEGNVKKLGEYTLEIAIDSLVIIPDLLVVKNAEIELGSGQGLFDCHARGDVVIGKHVVAVELMMPQVHRLGTLKISLPEGLSIADVLAYASFPDLATLPLIGKLLTTDLSSAALTLGTANVAGTAPKILGGSFEFTCDKLILGSLSLVAVAAQIEYHTPADPLGHAKEQTVFSISAAVADGSFGATVTYDTLGKRLTAAFYPVRVVSVVNAVTLLLGTEVGNALAPLVGGMGVAGAYVAFDVAGTKVTAASIHLVNTAELALHGVALGSLRLEYVAAQPQREKVPAKGASFELVGVTRGQKAGAEFRVSCLWADPKNPTTVAVSIKPTPGGSLTLSGILSLFSWDKPAVVAPEKVDSAKYFDLEIHNVSGEVVFTTDEKTKAKRLELKSLDAVVESKNTLTILDTPEVVLQKVALKVYYRSGKGTTADIWALLNIAEDVAVEVKYALDSTSHQPEYTGKLTINDPQHPRPDFKSLPVKFLPADTVSIPGNLGIPSSLPLVSLSAKLQPNKSLEIWGSGPPNWPIALGDLNIVVKNLGGRVYFSKDPKTAQGFLFGEMSLTAFASSRAQLQITRGKKPVLMASLTKPQKDGELAALATQLSKKAKAKAWAELLPPSTSSMSFDASAELYLDFETSTFAVFGSMKGLGHALFLANKDKSGTAYNYTLCLTVDKLAALWAPLQDPVDSCFSFDKIVAQISSQELVFHTLQDQLTTITADSAIDQGAKDKVSTLSTAVAKLPKATKIPLGACFYAVVSLTESTPLSKVLKFSAHPGTVPKIILGATIPRDLPANASFLVTISDFSLFGGAIVVPSGNGTYDGKAHKVMVNAQVELHLGGSPSPFSFDVVLTVDSNETVFDIATKKGEKNPPPPTIKSPFGGMFDLSLDVLKFNGSIQRTTEKGSASGKEVEKTMSKYELAGTIKIGDMMLNGHILFIDGVPKVATLKVGELPINTIFSHIVQGPNAGKDAAAWPKDFPNLKLKEAVIYYVQGKASITPPGERVTYQPGFNITATIEIFGVAFVVSANLPQDRSGLKLDGTYKGKIYFVFGQLGGWYTLTKGVLRAAEGPTVSIVSDKKKNEMTYCACIGLTLFGHEGFNGSLSYLAGSAGDFSGQAKYTGVIKVLGIENPTINFTYKDKKFSFKDLKVPMNMSDLDIAKAIRDASNDGSCCEQLVKLTFDKMVKTDFNLTVGVDGGKDTIDVNITGTFTIKLLKVSLAALPLTLAISVPFSKEFRLTLEGLQKYLEHTIKTNLTSLGKTLLDHPKEATILIGWMSAENFTKKTIASLLCRKIDPDNVYIKAKHYKDTFPDDNKPDSFWKLAGPAAIGLALNAITALDSAITAGEGFFALARANLAMLDKAIETLAKNPKPNAKYSLQEFQDARSKIQGMIAKRAKMLAEARVNIETSLNLSGAPKSHFIAADKETGVIIDWADVVPKGNKELKGFTWEIYTSTIDTEKIDPKVAPTAATTELNTIVSKEAFGYSPVIYAWVRARYVVGTAVYKSANWTRAIQATHIPHLRPPKNVVLTLDATGTNCILTVPGAAAGKYAFHLSKVTAQEVTGADDVVATAAEDVVAVAKVGDVSCTIPIARIGQHMFAPSEAGTKIQAQVRIKSSDGKVARDSPLTSSNTVSVVPAPKGLTLSLKARDLIISWEQARPASTGTDKVDYELLIDRDGKSIPRTLLNIKLVSRTDTSQIISIPAVGSPLQGSGSVTVYVRPLLPASKTSIALYASDTIAILPTPTIITSDTFYDLQTQTLHLKVTFSIPAGKAGVSAFMAFWGGEIGPTRVEDFTLDTDARVILDKSILPHPLPISVCISTINHKNERGPLSAPWRFPSNIPTSLPAIQPTPRYDPATSTIQIKWPLPMPPNVSNIAVELVKLSPTPESAELGRTFKVVDAKDQQVVFNNKDYVFAPGQRFEAVCMSWMKGWVRAACVVVEVEVPSADD